MHTSGASTTYYFRCSHTRHFLANVLRFSEVNTTLCIIIASFGGQEAMHTIRVTPVTIMSHQFWWAGGNAHDKSIPLHVTPVYSYTRIELSLRTKTSLLSLSTVDRLKALNIGYHLPRRHRSSQGVERKKQNLHSFIVASFMKDNGVDLFLVTETWLSAQGDKAKIVGLAPSGFDVKSFPRQSRSRGGRNATVNKSTLGSNITFKTNFDFTHISFEVVQASITL